MIRIFLVEDHLIVRQGIKNLLETDPKFAVVGEAEIAEELFEQANNNQFDVLLSDITLPGISGIELVRKAKKYFPGTKIVILSMHGGELYINDAFRAGADGYLLKDCSKAELFSGISKVLKGEKYCSRSISHILASNLLNSDSFGNKRNSKLEVTKREREILQLISEGYSNKEISEKLYLSVKTINAHRKNILKKLDSKNTAGLIGKALRLNLISLKP